MALSPYRFSIGEENNTLGRSRTGLSSVTAGGGGSGGEGYRRSALAPGSRGWYAAGFGAAPRTDYVPPTQTATVTVTPTVTPAAATQTATPTLVGPPEGDQNWNASHGEGAGAGGSQTGGPEGFDAGGKPGDMSGLAGMLGDISPGRGALAGASFGGSIGGIPGAVIGGILGYGLANAFGGGQQDKGSIGNDAKDGAMNSLGGAGGEMDMGGGKAGDMGNDPKGGDPAENNSFAKGGRVTSDRLMKGSPMKGLHGVKAGGAKKPGYMGGFAEGGRVYPHSDNYMGGFAAGGQVRPLPYGAHRAYEAGNYWDRERQSADPSFWGDVENAAGSVPKPDTLDDPGARFDPMLRSAVVRSHRAPRVWSPRDPTEAPGGIPNYADGGMVDGAGLAGPNPPGPDDGYAALDGGEYVVRASQAQRPEYGAILDQMNAGTYAPDGSAAHEGMESADYEAGEGGDDQDLAIGQGNMPPAGGEGVTPDDMMQRMATLPPEQRAALQQAATDPMLSGALFALLGPAFMQVIGMLQQPAAPPSPPGMMSMSPDMAGRRPPGGGGLASVNA